MAGILFMSDIAHFLIIILTAYIVSCLDISIIYHGIRGQSQLKLYGLIMILEV